jgi:hypothetical protein
MDRGANAEVGRGLWVNETQEWGPHAKNYKKIAVCANPVSYTLERGKWLKLRSWHDRRSHHVNPTPPIFVHPTGGLDCAVKIVYTAMCRVVNQ